MTDLEAVRLCAEAMGISVVEDGPQSEPPEHWLMETGVGEWQEYDPLSNAEQCLALVERFNISINRGGEATDSPWWKASIAYPSRAFKSDFSLRRAIVHCVAKAQAAKAAK